MQLPELAPVEWSIMVRDADSGAVLAEHEPTRRLRTASVGKIFLLVEVARQVEAGECDLTETVAWSDEERVEDSGLWHLMQQRWLPIGDLCVLIGGFSDNLATNALVRRFGLDAIARTSTSLGFRDSALLDRIRDHRGPDDPPTLSIGTAAELSDLVARLHRSELVSAAVSVRVLRWLATNADLSMVASAFGLDPLAHADPDRGVTLIDKTGTISTGRIDVGVVTGPAASVSFAVLADWAAGSDEHVSDPRDAVLATMREIGQLIRSHVGVTG